MNEELVTVNNRLKEKVEALNRANSDLLNLIASTDVGTIFLDARLCISRFTPRATELFHLVEADQGRPLAHITHRLRHTDLAGLAAHVSTTSERVEATVQDYGDRWYVLRLFPYRTITDEIEGVVITFIDISDLKRAESEERQRRQQQALATLSRQALISTDLDVLFAETTQQVAEVLGVEFCKLLQLQAGQDAMLLRAGVGWKAGLIGRATVPADTNSQAGYTLYAQSPVVLRDMASETRFHGPDLLLDHHVRSGISVAIHGPGEPFGVLGAHSQEARNYAPYDVDFLQSVANLLAIAIERQQAQLALRQSEEQARRHLNELEAIYNSAPIGLCVLDRELRYQRVNERLAEMNGLPVADHIGRTGRELFPDLAAKTEAALRNVLATGEPVIRLELTGEIPSQPGVPHTWIESWFPLHDAGGAVSAINIVIEEITEQKQAERAFEQSNAILRGILESSRDAIFVRDRQGRYILVNRAAVEQVGINQEGIIGKRYADLFPQHAANNENAVDIENNERAILELGLTQSTEYMLEHDGVTRYWNTLNMPLRNIQGDIVGIVSSARDITERRHAEEALRRTHETLALAQRMSHSGVWDWDLATNKTYWSPEFYALYGISPQTDPNLETWMAVIHPHDQARIEMRLQEVLAGNDEWNEEYRILHAQRGERWLLAVGQVSCDDDGQPVRFTGLNLDITERKETDAQLRYQAQLLDNVEDAVISTDAEFRIRTWNTGAEQLYNWTAQEVMGRTVSDVLDTEFAGISMEQARAELAARSHWRGEVIQRTKSGEPVNISNITVLMYDESGATVGSVAINRNITERKRAESRVQFLVQASTILAGSLDYGVTLQNVAEAAVPSIADWCAIDLQNESGSIENAALIHTDPAKVHWAHELRKRYPLDLNAPNGAPYVIRTGKSEYYPEITETMLEGVAQNEEGRELLRMVGYRSVMVVPLLLHDHVLGAISLVSSESQRLFTEADLHMAEDLGRRAAGAIENARLYQDLRQRQSELHESEERFRSTFEQAAVGMAHTSPEGYYLQVNERLCEIMGYSRAELLQKPFIDFVHPEEKARSAALNEQLIAGHLPSYGVEKRYIRRDGSFIWVHVTASSVCNEAGDVIYRLAVVEDISARKAAEAALQELNATLEQHILNRTAELERSNRDLDQFAYVASHDLRAPLRAIDHLANWIAEDVGDTLPTESRQHLDTLRGRVRRMEKLLEDLLTYSRVGRQLSAVEWVESGDLVSQIVELLDPPATFTIHIAANMPAFHTHRIPLELVLRNLINNAIKHHKGVDGRIDIWAQAKGEWFVFTVQDNGPGIDPAFHERIFQIFQTLRPRDELEGSGMGLAVVKKAVESMGGVIWVESAEGHGAAFRFTWPQRSAQ
ncbi:MAG: PAS domain S-box protein [Caldilineaceae bacterium]|nr:PAS domain S-box protein [Caldilineaceae bacterium]